MVDIFNLDDSTMGFLQDKKKNNDGIYRPDIKNAVDKKKGYQATIRFLPNLTQEGTVGQNSIEKFLHYADFKEHQGMSGYYDCQKHFPGEDCPLCKTFWALKNSKNEMDKEKAMLINRSGKYYSYVMILEDEQQPELVGKIMVYPYGFKIKEKIRQEYDGEVTGDKCTVFDLAEGKDFRLIIKMVAGYQNYDTSQFLANKTALKIKGKDGSFKEVPTVDNNGKKSIDPKLRDKVKEILLTREVELEDFNPKQWTPEQTDKANQIIGILTNQHVVSKATNYVDSGMTSKPASANVEDLFAGTDDDTDDFFDDL